MRNENDNENDNENENMKRIIFSLFFLASLLTNLFAQQLRVPRFFANHMVVQRGERIPVWGWAAPGSTVSVTFAGKKATATAATDGTWKAFLPKMKAGGPFTLSIACNGSSERIQLDDVLVGDVFLCSGQSNMELPIRRCMDVVANEVKDYSNDKIRYLKFPHQYNYVKPNDDVRALPWQNITPDNCAEVSGICYFMARELQEKYGVPIGIINSAVGGTPVQAWMPQTTLAQFEQYADEFKKPKYHQQNWPDSVNRAEMHAARQWEQKMNETDVIGGSWRAAGYDFAAWQSVDMFSNWSQGKNGSYWFHTTVDVPAELAGQKAVLRFGAMKDADSTFVNGEFVGNTTYEYPPRIYQVKEGVLRAGKNDIVVHLMSQSGRANFTKGKLYQLEVGDQVFKLSETLQMAVGCTMPPKPSSTYFVSGWTGLYNAMIAPLRDMPLKGILWYQGESNMSAPDIYATMLEAMTAAWRQQFKRQLPLVIMQLPGYMSRHEKPVETGWTKIRHQQFLAAGHIPYAGLAPTLDTGEFNDIHPQDKKTAGHRAALQMERLAYGEKLVACGPMPVSARIADGQAILTFAKETGRLTCRGDELHDFAIRVDGKFQWAKATIADDYTIRIELPAGLSRTTVRYCWDDYPQPSLFNAEGIPAPQFEIETN